VTEPQSVGRHVRVLIVEDHAMQRAHAAAVLAHIGIGDVLEAADGGEALRAIEAAAAAGRPVDVILCDLNMPNMDGLEFLRHLREIQCEIEVILTSAMDARILGAAESLARARDLNLLGSVAKPLQAAELKKLLAKERPGRARPRDQYRFAASELAEAIRGDALRAYYQPQVAAHGSRVHGFEALARWHHPERGLIGPSFFVPLAEDAGLAWELTESIFRTGVRQSAAWRNRGLDHRMAFNLSMNVLTDVTLPDRLERIVETESVASSRIVLEVTESRGIGNLADALEILTRLRIKGFELSIDDFGMGHSTLEQLRRFPFTELKIDQAYVTSAEQRPGIRAMLESTIQMARALGLRCIAEGVETARDRELVAELGCDEVQGYWIAGPLPAVDMTSWIANAERNAALSAGVDGGR
jgi:EAL domain-containing protein (putative c-di-GMP-specific phosphodiesterase class I)